MRNGVLDPRGNIIKRQARCFPMPYTSGSLRISFAYIDDPDDVYTIAGNYYGPLIEGDQPA